MKKLIAVTGICSVLLGASVGAAIHFMPELKLPKLEVNIEAEEVVTYFSEQTGSLVAMTTFGDRDGIKIKHEHIIIREDPHQRKIKHRYVVDPEGNKFTLKAKFDFRARILSRKRYNVDHFSDVAPIDFAIGWGPMSDPKVLKTMDLWQTRRWFYYQYSNRTPATRMEIITHLANVHMVPADERVRKDLMLVEEGDIVSVKGYLINVYSRDGWQKLSSEIRTDTGDGACEIVYVEEVEIET